MTSAAQNAQKGRPLELGDRVRVYTWEGAAIGQILPTPANRAADYPNAVYVLLTNGTHTFVHPKQCRRLVPRPRRKLVAKASPTGERLAIASYSGTYTPGEEVCFIEARRKPA